MAAARATAVAFVLHLRPPELLGLAQLGRKATRLWLDHMDEEVALCSVVRYYFYFGPRGGWAHVSSADISPHPSQGDPMWIVTAVKA